MKTVKEVKEKRNLQEQIEKWNKIGVIETKGQKVDIVPIIYLILGTIGLILTAWFTKEEGIMLVSILNIVFTIGGIILLSLRVNLSRNKVGQ